MDPPGRPHGKRRAVSAQAGVAPTPQNFTSDRSPSPFTSNVKYMHGSPEAIHSRPRSSTVSVGLVENDDSEAQRDLRLQIQLACVETKTITTTTTTKRSFPPLFVRQQPLDLLDAKEYPLAFKPTPTDLLKFSYKIEDPSPSDSEQPIKEIYRREVCQFPKSPLSYCSI